MIVTVTLNASLRVQYEAERVEWGAPNPVTRVRYRAGGQGLAVARVLRALGHDVVAAGFAGGSTGGLIAADLARSEVETRFTTISGESRRTLEVADTARNHTTILNEPPPYITTEELGRFAADYRRLLTGATVVVLSGTLPAGLPPEIYGSLATYAAEAGVPAIIDAAGPALWYGASRGPALVIPGTPDADEPAEANGSADVDGPAGAGGWAGKGGEDNGGEDNGGEDNGGEAAAALVAGGVGAVAVLSDHDVTTVTAVTAARQWRGSLDGYSGIPGSRDALVAGLIPAVAEGWSWPDTLRHAIALGAAADAAGEIDLDAYDLLLPEVVICPP
jgi:tagatose 6-phosphate kinase